MKHVSAIIAAILITTIIGLGIIVDWGKCSYQ